MVTNYKQTNNMNVLDVLSFVSHRPDKGWTDHTPPPGQLNNMGEGERGGKGVAVDGEVGHISHPLHYLPPVASQDVAGLGWQGLFGHPGSDTFQPEPPVP